MRDLRVISEFRVEGSGIIGFRLHGSRFKQLGIGVRV